MPIVRRHSLLRRAVVGALVAAFALVVLIAVPSSRAATASVEIVNFRFEPQTVTVAVGDTITWTNRDFATHDAVDISNQPPAFETPLLSNNQSATVRFKTPGTFAYYCSIHPGMRGTVVVQAEPFTDAVFLPSVTR